MFMSTMIQKQKTTEYEVKYRKFYRSGILAGMAIYQQKYFHSFDDALNYVNFLGTSVTCHYEEATNTEWSAMEIKILEAA